MLNNLNIEKNLLNVRNKIKEVAAGANRQPSDIRICAVSKTFSNDYIRVAINAGQKIFGENRVQEAQVKWTSLKSEYSDLELHLIGPLQRNKVRKAVAIFDVIQTVDRFQLAQDLTKEMSKTDRHLCCYVQVNIGQEPQKSGVLPSETGEFVNSCQNDLKLPIKGLMCIPPKGTDPRPHFESLQGLALNSGLPELSMGMSEDYPTAVASGATIVRVGSAIFGTREIAANQ